MTNITQFSTNFKATAFMMCIFKRTSGIYSVKILLSYSFSVDLDASMQIFYLFHKLYFLLVQRHKNEPLLYFYHWTFSIGAELQFYLNNFLYYKEKLSSFILVIAQEKCFEGAKEYLQCIWNDNAKYLEYLGKISKKKSNNMPLPQTLCLVGKDNLICNTL